MSASAWRVPPETAPTQATSRHPPPAAPRPVEPLTLVASGGAHTHEVSRVVYGRGNQSGAEQPASSNERHGKAFTWLLRRSPTPGNQSEQRERLRAGPEVAPSDRVRVLARSS